MANEKRLIDANALLLEIEEELAHETPFFTHEQNEMIDCGLRIASKDIRYQPTVDAVEVVHGQWVCHDPVSPNCFCSVCHYDAPWDDFGDYHSVRTNYCPNCGAKMDGGNEDV